jgi:dTDP-4-amino-4,6-dideoxygalactose transaminase
MRLPPAPDSDNLRYDIFQNYEVEAENRGALRETLTAAGVGTILQWGGHMIHQFEKLELRHNAPYAEALSAKFMLLPMHHLLSDDDVHYASEVIRKFYGR